MHKLKLYFILLLLLPLSTLGQGLPLIQSYKATKYGGGVQNWDIYIDKSNIVYFSHNEGVTTFDGKKWEHFRNSNISHIRCMSMGAGNRLYAGGYFEFGYFEPNILGKLEYTSLMDRFVDTSLQFTYVWSVAATSSNTVFTIRDQVLLYDMDSIKVIKSNCKLSRVFNIFDNTILFSRGEGILKLSGTEFTPLPGLDMFKDDTYVLITEFSDNQILLCSELSGIWIYNYGAALTNQKQPYLRRIETNIEEEISSELLSDIEYDSLRNTIHICTMTTLYSIDTLGITKSILGFEQGIVGKYAISIKCDRLGNVWVGTGNGVSYVHMASPLRFIDNRLGNPEHPYDILFNSDYSYLSTMGGLSIIKTEDLLKSPAKPLTEMISDQIGGWEIHNLDNRIITSVGYKIIEIVADKVKTKLSKVDAYSITNYSKKDQILFLGGVDNSYLLDMKNKNRTTKMENLAGSVKRAVAVGEYHILAEFFSENTFNIYRDSAGKDVFQIFDKNLGFNAKYGVPIILDSNAYLCTSNGLYKVLFNKDKSVDTVFLDRDFEQFKELKNNLLWITLDTASDGYWATTEKDLIFIKKHKNKPNKVIKNPFKIVPRTDEIFLFKNFVVTLYTEGVCFYDKNKPTLDTTMFNTIFREIKFDKEYLFNGYYPFDSNSNNHIKIKQPIKYDKNNLKVSFISPYYFYQDSIKYECILENFDKEWINLGSNTEKEYTNIPPGNYCFKVRSINVFDSVSEVAELHFSISTPWYQTAWMISIYIIVAILFVILIIKLNTHRLKKQNELLEQTVLSRTKELQQKALNISEQNEKIKEQNEQIKEQSREIEFANKQLSQLSVVAQQTDNGVLIIKYPNSIRYINNGMLKMLEIENFKQSDNQQNREILLRLQNLTKVLQETLETSEPNVFEAIVTTFKNQKKWMQITVSPVYEFELQTEKVVVVCTDISDIKLAEEEISQQKEVLYSQSVLLRNTNTELAKANQLMRDSITCAQRIQKSMLPNIKEIRAVFTDTFIFFKPKDIVSGDFYWFNKIDDSYIIIVADCVGHGVPGAFMSMIGNTLLKDTVSHKIQNPAQILTHLNDGIKTILRQKGKIDNIQNDGSMDITVCIYNPELKEIQIALANHRALLIRKDEINIIEGDIFAVGDIFTHMVPVKYTYKQYSIEQGDVLYMYTDGFQDQLGGADYSKYGSTRLLKHLETIYKEPFKNQLSKLKNEFVTWKKNKKQTDDILIWGIKF